MITDSFSHEAIPKGLNPCILGGSQTFLLFSGRAILRFLMVFFNIPKDKIYKENSGQAQDDFPNVAVNIAGEIFAKPHKTTGTTQNGHEQVINKYEKRQNHQKFEKKPCFHCIRLLMQK